MYSLLADVLLSSFLSLEMKLRISNKTTGYAALFALHIKTKTVSKVTFAATKQVLQASIGLFKLLTLLHL